MQKCLRKENTGISHICRLNYHCYVTVFVIPYFYLILWVSNTLFVLSLASPFKHYVNFCLYGFQVCQAALLLSQNMILFLQTAWVRGGLPSTLLQYGNSVLQQLSILLSVVLTTHLDTFFFFLIYFTFTRSVEYFGLWTNSCFLIKTGTYSDTSQNYRSSFLVRKNFTIRFLKLAKVTGY